MYYHLKSSTFCRQHLEYLKVQNPRKASNERWLQNEHNRSFASWIRDQVFNFHSPFFAISIKSSRTLNEMSACNNR